MAFELNVVLVRTLYPSNLGSTARAMANMGATRLILIDPRCEPAASKAKMAAAGAQYFLENQTVYDSWKDFYDREGGGFRIALTRRNGKRRETIDLRTSLELLPPTEVNQPLYLVFGPEDNGLEQDDLQFINGCASLPVYGTYPSYNLSQAVLAALLITQDFLHADQRQHSLSQQPAGERRPLNFPDQTLRAWIEAIGFDIEARKSSAYLTFRKLLLQNLPTDAELHVLESILQQNIRKLKAPY